MVNSLYEMDKHLLPMKMEGLTMEDGQTISVMAMEL